MTKISAVIITFNEEKNIGRCLESLNGIVDEIVIVDSFSTDGTKDICSKFENVTFLDQKWLGYSESKNVGNDKAQNDWILSIDADEALDEKLQKSIMKLKDSELSDKEVYYFNRITNYCGQWIKHCGWYPEWKMRIWNRKIGRWIGDVHETVDFANSVVNKKLKGHLLHYSYYSISEHIVRMDKYTTISAQNMFERGVKVSLFKAIVKSKFRFFRDYILKRGILDGYSGYLICRIVENETLIKYSKLRQLYKSK